MRKLILLITSLICLSASAQKQKIGDFIESTSYNLDKIGVERRQQYFPERNGFVSINGENRYTRALYGSHTDWRLETSDRPIFAVVKKDHHRNIRFELDYQGKSIPLEKVSFCKAHYAGDTGGARFYALFEQDWIDSLGVVALASPDRERAIWMFFSPAMKDKASIRVIVSPIVQPKLHRNGDIGAIVVSKISSRDFKKIIELTIYYEDKNGEESLPYYPLENRQISVLETDLWTGQEDWSEDWYMNIFTDELLYKYNELYDDTVDEEEKKDVDWQLSFWINRYLDGTCITRQGCKQYLDSLKTECAKKVLMKRIVSYLEHKEFHFADKELFSDEEEEAESSYGEVVKQYEPTYELAYIDGQGHPQRKTIKNANMNSFVAGIKFRENYEEMLSKLEEGMELQIKPEPDNEFDPDALAVYHDEDHLGYIPKKDIPAVSLDMENECGFAEIEYVDEEHIDLVIPVSFHKLSTMSDDELENYRFYKTEKTKYEKGYVENSSPISKEEFLEGISQQKSNL